MEKAQHAFGQTTVGAWDFVWLREEEQEEKEVKEQEKNHTVWMPNWANNVGDFIPNSTLPPPLPLSHTRSVLLLCRSRNKIWWIF